MIQIKKTYHFYAAHRNENLADKCWHLHGHTYYVTVILEPGDKDKAGITILFADIDNVIDPIIKLLDHSFMVHVADPLLPYLEKFNKEHGNHLNMFGLANPTSCENIAQFLFRMIATKLPIVELHLQETTSSTVIIKK